MDRQTARLGRMDRTNRSKGARLAAFVAVLALIAASCGAGETSATGEGSAPDSGDTSSGESSPANATSEAVTPDDAFPGTKVVNLADGSEIKLSESLAGGTTPVMLWFYFPH